MMSGEASALRNRPCICTPATASPAPTSAATMTRGARINQTMTCCGSAMSLTSTHPCGKKWEAKTRATAPADTGVVPTAIPAMNATKRRAATIAKYPAARGYLRPRENRARRAGGASIVLLSVAIDSICLILDETHDVVRDGEIMPSVDHDDAP